MEKKIVQSHSYINMDRATTTSEATDGKCYLQCIYKDPLIFKFINLQALFSFRTCKKEGGNGLGGGDDRELSWMVQQPIFYPSYLNSIDLQALLRES